MHKKGILKKNCDDKKKTHIQFDEECIKEQEKMRGNKMKIDEPKTPYEYSDEDAKEENQKKLREKLKEFNVQHSDEVPNKHEEFLKKRNEHYKNEFRHDN